MKIVCAYCDSYVDVDMNSNCPMCGAPLGTAIKEEEERQALARKKAIEEAEKKEAALKKAQEEKEAKERNAEIIKSVVQVAGGAILGGALGRFGNGRPGMGPKRRF